MVFFSILGADRPEPKGRKVVNMTIKELKQRVPKVGMVKLPSVKALKEANIPVMADTDDSPETYLGEGCRAIVYMNGLVLYTNGGYSTIFRLHKCRETYGIGDAKDFVDIPYQFMLMMEGERRLEHNQDMKEANWNTSADHLEEEFGYEVPGREDVLESYISKETVEFIFSILTEKQKEVVRMYCLEQKRQADIAEILGIQRVTVATILRTAFRVLRENYPMC